MSLPALLSRRGLLAMSAAATVPAALPAQASEPAFPTFVRDAMAAAGIPGMAVGHVRDGRVRLAAGYGLANVETGARVSGRTVFHCASLTKPVIVTAAMMLAEAGLLDLDGPVAPHLDFPVASPAHPETPVTFRHLMTHTSGLSDKTYYEVDFRQRGRDATTPLGDFLRAYLSPGGTYWSADGSYSGAAPGAVWDYSNVGIALLGYAAGRIAGRDLRAFISDQLFAPLGVRSAVWSLADAPHDTAVPYDLADGVRTAVEPVGFPDWPAGMLRASVGDYARFLAASTTAGRILSAHSLNRMMTPTRPQGLPEWLAGQGLGWQMSRLEGRDLVEHWGGDPGVCNAAYIDPASRTAVAIFTNASASREVMAAVKAVAARLLIPRAA